jgi:hypothetical protein
MEVFRGLEFRSIGPSLTTGRIADLEVDPNDSNVWYLAVGSGGLWKTVNRGLYKTTDGGWHWVELRGGIPRIAARDLHIQR